MGNENRGGEAVAVKAVRPPYTKHTYSACTTNYCELFAVPMGLTTVLQLKFCTFLTLLNIKACDEHRINFTQAAEFHAFLVWIWPWRGEGKDWVCGPLEDRAQNRPSYLCILVHRKKAWWKVRPLALGYMSCKIAKSMRQNDPYDKKRKTRTPSQNIFLHVHTAAYFSQSPSLQGYTILYWLWIFTLALNHLGTIWYDFVHSTYIHLGM